MIYWILPHAWNCRLILIFKLQPHACLVYLPPCFIIKLPPSWIPHLRLIDKLPPRVVFFKIAPNAYKEAMNRRVLPSSYHFATPEKLQQL